MKPHVQIRPRAEADMRDARHWYESQRQGLGKEFLVDIGTAIDVLARDPERHPDYYPRIPPDLDEAIPV